MRCFRFFCKETPFSVCSARRTHRTYQGEGSESEYRRGDYGQGCVGYDVRLEEADNVLLEEDVV